MLKREKYTPDGRKWSTPFSVFGQYALRCNMTRLNERYREDKKPDWDVVDIHSTKTEWWAKSVSSLYKIHVITFDQVLLNGITNVDPRERWIKDQHFDLLYAYKIRVLLREIDLRGPNIIKETLGRWKSPIILTNRGIHNLVKSAKTVDKKYGGSC